MEAGSGGRGIEAINVAHLEAKLLDRWLGVGDLGEGRDRPTGPGAHPAAAHPADGQLNLRRVGLWLGPELLLDRLALLAGHHGDRDHRQHDDPQRHAHHRGGAEGHEACCTQGDQSLAERAPHSKKIILHLTRLVVAVGITRGPYCTIVCRIPLALRRVLCHLTTPDDGQNPE